MKKSVLRLTVCLALACLISFGLLTSTYAVYQKTLTFESGTISIDMSKIDTDKITYEDAITWLAEQAVTPGTTTYKYFAKRAAGSSINSTGVNFGIPICNEMNAYFGTTNAQGFWNIEKLKNGKYCICWTAYDGNTLKPGTTIPDTVYRYYTGQDGDAANTVETGTAKVTTLGVEGNTLRIINLGSYKVTGTVELHSTVEEDELPSDLTTENNTPSDYLSNNVPVSSSASSTTPSDYISSNTSTTAQPSDLIQSTSDTTNTETSDTTATE